MTQQRAGRGRPRGTGLDDSSYLNAIGEMIASKPDLKPTTAIKELGITDPSVIRRLRDKYQASLQGFALSETTGQQPTVRAMAAAVTRDPAIKGPKELTPKKPAAEAAPGAQGFDQAWAKLVGLGVGLFVVGVETQTSLFAIGIKNVPVGPILQTQVMVTEAILQFAADLITVPGQLA